MIADQRGMEAFWFLHTLFSGPLSRQSLLHSALLARLQVVGVTLHFLNDVSDVFRLNLRRAFSDDAVELLPNSSPQTSLNRTYQSLFPLCYVGPNILHLVPIHPEIVANGKGPRADPNSLVTRATPKLLCTENGFYLPTTLSAVIPR